MQQGHRAGQHAGCVGLQALTFRFSPSSLVLFVSAATGNDAQKDRVSVAKKSKKKRALQLQLASLDPASSSSAAAAAAAAGYPSGAGVGGAAPRTSNQRAVAAASARMLPASMMLPAGAQDLGLHAAAEDAPGEDQLRTYDSRSSQPTVLSGVSLPGRNARVKSATAVKEFYEDVLAEQKATHDEELGYFQADLDKALSEAEFLEGHHHGDSDVRVQKSRKHWERNFRDKQTPSDMRARAKRLDKLLLEEQTSAAKLAADRDRLAVIRYEIDVLADLVQQDQARVINGEAKEEERKTAEDQLAAAFAVVERLKGEEKAAKKKRGAGVPNVKPRGSGRRKAAQGPVGEDDNDMGEDIEHTDGEDEDYEDEESEDEDSEDEEDAGDAPEGEEAMSEE